MPGVAFSLTLKAMGPLTTALDLTGMTVLRLSNFPVPVPSALFGSAQSLSAANIGFSWDFTQSLDDLRY